MSVRGPHTEMRDRKEKDTNQKPLGRNFSAQS